MKQPCFKGGIPVDFCRLCGLSAAEYEQLQGRVDLCARLGRSYELGDCRLPEGCRPGHACPGFWKQEGAYFFYLRPAVDYGGTDPALRRFFAQAIRRFARFEDLAGLLRSLAAAPPDLPAFDNAPGGHLALMNILQERVVGQDAALEAAAFKLWGHVRKIAPARPLSLIFYGPTCVGKSELGKAVAPALNRLLGEERYRLVWTELNTFTEAHSVYRLTGAPPGYAGYDDAPVLEAVREHPCTVFMFDELDKAHPELLKVFMSILDEGRCAARKADEQGNRELDFRRCIFLFTTNAGLSAPPPRLGFAPPEMPVPSGGPCQTGPAGLAQKLFLADEDARRALVRAGVLKEIAGRFSGLIGFQPLSSAARAQVTALQIAALGREFGLNICRVEPDTAQALTPGGALSQRSAAGVLEGVLGPLFLTCAQAGQNTAPLCLSGTAQAPLLCPLPEVSAAQV